ncbi:cyclin-F-like isoform X2 [Physella acuta]|uniref:cyclin-F-like isoform X2 n=1 Tax=Physella acuta TaxID=109671 RepID=UPI0027DD13CE|nr:cyclin-F-like isoform X2 [Physella acuta]
MKALKHLGSLQIKINTEENAEKQPTEGTKTKSFHNACYRPRTRSTVTIWNLPDSVIVHILRGMHVCDLLSFRSVHPCYRDIVDNNNSLWCYASFADTWPDEKNLHHFVKAAEKKNIEAAIKLAVAYLYKEGLTKEDISKVSLKAAHYLCLAETLTPNTFPFFWIFIRPPWSPDGSCCKIQTFLHIKSILEKTENPDLAFGVALTLKLQRLSMQTDSKEEEQKYFKIAVEQKSAAAAFFSLLDVIPEEPDKAKELERIRLFRHIASSNVLEAKLSLIRCYTQGQYGGISSLMAQEFVQQFFSSSAPSGIHLTFTSGRTSDISRYILVDWLVEVVGMKDFSAHTLYLAVSMFDRFLQVRKVQRSQVQLLGVAAMVVSSRYLGFDILTIKEAAWLTDNSYTYHDVVRMMGELVAALNGDLRVLTIQDYIKVLVSMVGEVGYSAMLIEYIAMLCLLQSEMGQYSPAEIAASCLLLSRLLLNHADPWPTVVQEWTGFSQDSLSLCTFHIYNKCLLEGSEVEYRETKLQAVKMRYADVNRYSVSSIEIIGHKELCRRLGVTKLISDGKDTKAIKFRNTDELIMSPHRSMSKDYHRHLNLSFEEGWLDRSNAATPPIKKAYVLDEGVSGYEGDLEDDSDESFSDKSDVLYELNEESDLDRSVLVDAIDNKDLDVSLVEDDEESVNSESAMISGTTLFSCLRIDEKLACLSSMCLSGSNMACHSARLSTSSCISNCSCVKSKSYTLGSSSVTSGFASSSGLSFSSPSLLFTSSASTSESYSNVQNARMCIPCGNIQSAPRTSRKSKGNANSFNTTADVEQPCLFSIRKSKSSVDLSSFLPAAPSGSSLSAQANASLNKQSSHDISQSFYSLRPSHDPQPPDSEHKIVSTPGNSHSTTLNSTTQSFRLLPTTCSGKYLSPTEKNAVRYQSTTDRTDLLVPATPETVPETHSSNRAPMRNTENLCSISSSSANSSGYTLKKARLDYSDSLRSAVELAQNKLGLTASISNCDKPSESNLHFSPLIRSEQPSQYVESKNVQPLARRKRKSCL